MIRRLTVIVIVCSFMRQEILSAELNKIVKRHINDANCGSPMYPLQTSGRVVGGEESNPHAWPWKAMLICVTPSNTSICGGSIIATQWILTAGHCIHNETYDIFRDCKVFLGRQFLPIGKHKLTENAKAQTFQIAEYFFHDNYKADDLTLGFDLALLKLSTTIKYTNEIRPICLPSNESDPTNTTMCYSGGWGYTEGRKVSVSPVLKQIRMPIQEGDYCSFTAKAAQQDLVLCAGKWGREHNLCYGDSGGGLDCRSTSDSKWYVHGVLSQVDKYCVSVASFAKVRKFLGWIERHI